MVLAAVLHHKDGSAASPVEAMRHHLMASCQLQMLGVGAELDVLCCSGL